MEPYGIPTDQFAIYQNSVHGKALLLNQDMRAPTCASCHGSHDAKPPQSSEVVGVCGKCHTATQALYEESRHSKLDVGPKCWTCHGTHDVAQPDESRFFHPKPPEIDCTTCHNPSDRTLILNADRFTNDAGSPLRHVPPPGIRSSTRRRRASTTRSIGRTPPTRRPRSGSARRPGRA